MQVPKQKKEREDIKWKDEKDEKKNNKTIKINHAVRMENMTYITEFPI